jgi:hypothetical protein
MAPVSSRVPRRVPSPAPRAFPFWYNFVA